MTSEIIIHQMKNFFADEKDSRKITLTAAKGEGEVLLYP